MDVVHRLSGLRTFLVWMAAAGLVVGAGGPALAAAGDAARTPGVLTFDVRVTMPDGSAAADVVVESIGRTAEKRCIERTDADGKAHIRGVFGNGLKLHASSSDGRYQAVEMFTPCATRAKSKEPIALRLEPAEEHDLKIEAAGKTVPGAHVVAFGHSFRVEGVTDEEGSFTLRTPHGESINELAAWHPQLGIAGEYRLRSQGGTLAERWSLAPPAPFRVRIVDRAGQPVAGLEIGVGVSTEQSDWILARELEATHATTDDNGEAVFPWVPKEGVKYVDVEIYGEGWKVDTTDLAPLSERVATTHVRRRVPVEGRVTMPNSKSAGGLLISGFGFGPGNQGDVPAVRTRPDGTFTVDAAAVHGYVLGISDCDWGGSPWSGTILQTESARPAEIAIRAERAVPVTVRVTRGESRVPVADAWVHVHQDGDVRWTDETGKRRSGTAGPQTWLRTDAAGTARTGVGRGKLRIVLNHGDWIEEREAEVKSDESVEVDFHRAWQGERELKARLVHDGGSHELSPSAAVLAWTERELYVDIEHKPRRAADGTIEVTFDGDNVSLLVVDRERGLSGFGRWESTDSAVDVEMRPLASYGGTVEDAHKKPLAGHLLRLCTESSFLDVAEAQRTDAAGRFRFSHVPSGAPLRLALQGEDPESGYILFDDDQVLEPGESREDESITARRLDSLDQPADSELPLRERLANAGANARAVGMRTAVILCGDDSENVTRATERLLDTDETESMLGYLPVTVPAKEIASESGLVAEHKWSLPATNEIVIVIMDGETTIAREKRIAIEDLDGAVASGGEFLSLQQPAGRDAREVVAEARDQAEASGRRVWLIESGPRCGPCFRLARWIKEHHAELEKDLVIVKLMGGIDGDVRDVFDELSSERGGIPWHAITEPDGTILVTSNGPRGNIGMPGSKDGIAHFRTMLEKSCRRLSSEEIDKLVASLSK